MYAKGTNNLFKVEKINVDFPSHDQWQNICQFSYVSFQANVITVYYSMDTTN